MSAAVATPNAHAVAVALLPIERLRALARQIDHECTDPTISRAQRLYVIELLAPIAEAIRDELAKRGEGQ